MKSFYFINKITEEIKKYIDTNGADAVAQLIKEVGDNHTDYEVLGPSESLYPSIH